MSGNNVVNKLFCRSMRFALLLIVGALHCDGVVANEPVGPMPLKPHRGFDVLRGRAFLPPDFDQQVFDSLWTVWPEAQRARAEQATAVDRRIMTRRYYGLVSMAGEEQTESPGMGYLSNGKSGWVMNCLACHGGQVAGRAIPGLPNSNFALQTLVEDVAQVKLTLRKLPGHLELGAVQTPLGGSDGTTNSVMFGVILGAYRRPDMSVNLGAAMPKMTHHDMDAPPFWNVKYKKMIYCDGFSPNSHRPMMQFILLPKYDRETIYRWEEQFQEIASWIRTVEAPAYPFEIDKARSLRGQLVFEQTCAKCHGTYRDGVNFPEVVVPIDVVGTDATRLKALTPEHRQWMKSGWLSRYGQDDVVVDPVGYVAPPLKGIWATAPYFHNGSVPTLWHLLHPDVRPKVWRRTFDGYDRQRVGLEVKEFPGVPVEATRPGERRRYFDATLPSKSNAGHPFQDGLSEEEKADVLEYLKSL